MRMIRFLAEIHRPPANLIRPLGLLKKTGVRRNHGIWLSRDSHQDKDVKAHRATEYFANRAECDFRPCWERRRCRWMDERDRGRDESCDCEGPA